MEQISQRITAYYNQLILRLQEEAIHTSSCHNVKTSFENKASSVTGLKVHGNKKWFLDNFTEIGYETEFKIEDFEKLAEDVIHYNGYFIFCCRITRKHQKVKSHENAYGIDDLHIKHIIDNSFLGHGLYYRDYPYNIGGVAIERVITNFHFEG